MERTKKSLREVRVYIGLLLVCVVYAVVPAPPRHTFNERVKDRVEAVGNWLQGQKLEHEK